MKILSRLLVIAAASVPFGRWLAGQETAKMERYRTLSHDALLAVLQEHHKGSLGFSYAGAFVLLGGAFLLVHGGGIAIDRLVTYLRISSRT